MPKDTPPHLDLIADLLNAMSKYSKESQKQVTGQCTIEHPEDKEPPMLAMYFCNHLGNYMVWFADAGKFHLYLHVDGKTRRVASILVSNFHQLQAYIDKIKPELVPEEKKKRKGKGKG